MYSLTMEAVLGVIGCILILAGTIFGTVEFVRHAIIENIAAPAGTVMTAALPIFLGFQMVINALLLDIQSVPVVPLCERFEVKYPGEVKGVEREVNLSGGVGR